MELKRDARASKRKKIIKAQTSSVVDMVPSLEKYREEVKDEPFEELKEQADAENDPKRKRLLLAQAYASADGGFLPFAIDICGLNRLYPAFHERMGQFVTGFFRNDVSRIYHADFRIVLAFRGCYKSSLGSIALPAWLIARSTLAGNYETCEATIGLASERDKLARAHVSAVRKVVTGKRFTELYGDHKPDTRGTTGGKWASDSFTSVLQADSATKDPTVGLISLGADQTGFHFDTIIADDLQAFSTSYSRDQLEKTDELYRLLFGLLNPGGQLLVMGTRWHPQDIYGRILYDNSIEKDARRQFAVLVRPAEIDGKSTFPQRFPAEELARKRKQMKNNYGPQMLLNPIASEDRIFQRSDLQYVTESIRESLKKKELRVLMGVDPSWVSEERLRQGQATTKAFSVVCTVAVDPGHNYYILDLFRKRVGREALLDEIWRQWDHHRPSGCGIQSWDYKHLADDLKRRAELTGIFPRWVWLKGTRGQSKEDRLQGSLEGLVSSSKLFIPTDAEWLVDEFSDFPLSETFDGMDGIANAIQSGSAPDEPAKPESPQTEAGKWIDSLLAGEFSKKDQSWENAY